VPDDNLCSDQTITVSPIAEIDKEVGSGNEEWYNLYDGSGYATITYGGTGGIKCMWVTLIPLDPLPSFVRLN